LGTLFAKIGLTKKYAGTTSRLNQLKTKETGTTFMPSLNNANCRIYWRTDGNPDLPALVLSNSLGTDHTLWDPILDELLKHFYVVRYDTRGHGGSDAPAGDYTLNELTDDVQAVIAAARLTKYDFCGISLGGMTGMELAARRPIGLRRLILSNTGAEFPAGTWDQRITAIKQGGMAAVVDGILGRFFTPDFVTKNSIGLQRVRNAVLTGAPQGYIGCCSAIRDMELYPRLSQIQVPTLVIVGDFDQSTPLARGQALVERIKGSKLVTLPCAHIPPTEIPEQYVQTVLPFLLS
jgi:3-oxoadipate enol-lactonase